MNIQVRSVERDDAPDVALLGRQTFTETFGDLFKRHPEDLAQYLNDTFGVAKIRRSVGEPENHYWLACVDELPVGYAKLKSPSQTPQLPGRGVAQLQKIYLLRDYLAQSIGAPLLQAACDRAVALDVQTIWLSVLAENERAIRFYARHGFVTFGQTTFAIGAQTFNFDMLRKEIVAMSPLEVI